MVDCFFFFWRKKNLKLLGYLIFDFRIFKDSGILSNIEEIVLIKCGLKLSIVVEDVSDRVLIFWENI